MDIEFTACLGKVLAVFSACMTVIWTFKVERLKSATGHTSKCDWAAVRMLDGRSATVWYMSPQSRRSVSVDTINKIYLCCLDSVGAMVSVFAHRIHSLPIHIRLPGRSPLAQVTFAGVATRRRQRPDRLVGNSAVPPRCYCQHGRYITGAWPDRQTAEREREGGRYWETVWARAAVESIFRACSISLRHAVRAARCGLLVIESSLNHEYLSRLTTERPLADDNGPPLQSDRRLHCSVLAAEAALFHVSSWLRPWRSWVSAYDSRCIGEVNTSSYHRHLIRTP